nr:Beta-galactosidase C-terminal domain [Ignavibacterium sp.]
VTTEFMDSKTQLLLANYIKAGGHLIMYPVIPTMDLYLNPCTVLKQELKTEFSKSISPNKVNAFGIEDLFTIFKDKQVFADNNSDVVAITESDEVCGIRKKVGKGVITLLGFAFGYSSDEHLHLYEKLVSLDKIKKQAKVSDSDIQFVLRRGKKNSYLFLLNYHNQKKTFTVDSKKVVLNPLSYKVIKNKY